MQWFHVGVVCKSPGPWQGADFKEPRGHQEGSEKAMPHLTERERQQGESPDLVKRQA